MCSSVQSSFSNSLPQPSLCAAHSAQCHLQHTFAIITFQNTMDHDQGPPVLPLWLAPPNNAPQHSMSTVAAEAIDDVIEKPASARRIIIGALEEFAIGCISGITGAALSLVQFRGLYWFFYILILPTLVLEILESYALFRAACHKPQCYTSTMHKAASKKRLSRQLFGQGVIMGQGALDFASTRDESQLLSIVSLYATLWLCWTLLCYTSQSHAPEDKLVETGINLMHNEALDRRKRGIRRDNNHVNARNRRSTMRSFGSGGSVGSCSLSSRTSTTNRCPVRRSPSTVTLPLGVSA
jgi:hypothetical protein